MAPVAQAWCNALNELTAGSSRLKEFQKGQVLSNVTADVYDGTVAEVRAYLGRQVTAPVRFVELCENLYARGARVFLEVGPGRTLSSLVKKIFGARPHISLASDPMGKDPHTHLAELADQLVALGMPMQNLKKNGACIVKPSSKTIANRENVANIFFKANAQV